MAPEGSTDPERQSISESKAVEIGSDLESFLSPRFKSAAAMAGWDEEALLIASLVVDDTPERELRRKKRCVLQSNSPPSGSGRKRRTPTSLVSIPVAVLDLDEEQTAVEDDPRKQSPETAAVAEAKKNGGGASSSSSSPSALPLPCMDKLREELSCAICLEICFEPTTTPCGHSFCKKCLRSAADKCGKRCPKCRQLISNGRSCTVNTVLWNTIQLLFPKEVEARKQAKECSRSQEKVQNPEKAFYSSFQNHNTRATGTGTGTSSRHGSSRRRGVITIQDEDGELDSRMMQRVVSSNAESRVQSRVRGASSNAESRVQSRVPRRSIRPVRMATRDVDASSRRGAPDQDQDAALALRLQREEFMEAFRDSQVQTRSSLSLARANLRAMASRAAINLRINGRLDL